MSLRDEQLDVLKVGDKSYDYYRIADLEGVDHLPYSLKVLVENPAAQHRRRQHHRRAGAGIARMGSCGGSEP